MNTRLLSVALRRVVVVLMTLLMPAWAWASDHLLSLNGITVAQNAVVSHTGAVTTPLIVSNLDSVASVTFDDNVLSPLTVVSIPVKMCKPGTKGQLEWLDQGVTVVGVDGSLTSDVVNNQNNFVYRLDLATTVTVDNYSSLSGSCSTAGAVSYTRALQVAIFKRNGNSANFATTPVFTNTFNFWNVSSTVPEPGTVLLMALGLLALGWSRLRRVRSSRTHSA